jgi:hypothetical protein
MGVLAALAGLIVAARLDSATPNAGDDMELDVIAACFIGAHRDSHWCSGWRFYHRRIEQWHVYCWSGNRLAEGCQRHRFIGCGFV